MPDITACQIWHDDKVKGIPSNDRVQATHAPGLKQEKGQLTIPGFPNAGSASL